MRVALRPAPSPAMPPRTTSSQLELIKSALTLASKRMFDHLLYIGDLPLPDEAFRGKSKVRKKLVQAVVSEAQRSIISASDIPVIALPQYDLGRQEKLKLALVGGIARGLYRQGDVILSLLTLRPASMPDSIMIVTVGPEDEDGAFGFLQAKGVQAEVLDALIDMAGTIGGEGWEGRPLRALFAIGESQQAMGEPRP